MSGKRAIQAVRRQAVENFITTDFFKLVKSEKHTITLHHVYISPDYFFFQGLLRWLAGPVVHGAGCSSLAWPTVVWASAGGPPAAHNGAHFTDCQLDDTVNAQANDKALIDKVWTKSEELIDSVFV